MRLFGRMAALFLLACIPVSFFYGYGLTHRSGIRFQTHGSSVVVSAVPDKVAARAGVRVGDTVDLATLDVGDRVRLVTPPFWRPFDVPLVDNGRHFSVRATTVVVPISTESAENLAVTQLVAVVGLILGAIVLWRRPGPLAIAFGAFAVNGLYALPTSLLLSFLPDPWFSCVVVVISVALGSLPLFALLAFVLRFPVPLSGRRGMFVTRTFDGIIVADCVLSVIRTLQVPTLRDFSDPLLDVAPTIFATLALVVIVFVRYATSRGEDRRRLGWVALGAVVTSIGTMYVDLGVAGVLPFYPLVDTISSSLQIALPIAFAYAILRHRVMDLSFAINRTVVYGAITATLVVAVSAVDWMSGKLLSGTHLSAIVEAIATISFGVALSWFHGRVERVVDRVLFRNRYLAAKRIESRINALGFATSTQSIDEALVDEVTHVLRTGSAAVFRRAGPDSFERTAAHGWDAAPRELTIDHLLVRTLRAEERTVDLRDAGIPTPKFSAGPARPQIAIPIVVRHEFLGFVLYGPHHDDVTLDREDVALLERLVAAAAIAYDAVDAAEWRRRALAIEPIGTLG